MTATAEAWHQGPAAVPAGHAVAWEAAVPSACDGRPLFEALQAVQPDLYKSKTAAKMALRRGTVLVQGRPAASHSQ